MGCALPSHPSLGLYNSQYEPGSVHEEEMRHMIGCILGKKRAQEAALHCIPNSGVVEHFDEGQHAKHV